MTSLKPSSITSFFAAKPSTSTKKRKPEVVEIDVDKIPERIMIVTTEKDRRLLNFEVGVAKKNLATCMFGRAVICRRRLGSCGHYGQPGGQWPVPENPKKIH